MVNPKSLENLRPNIGGKNPQNTKKHPNGYFKPLYKKILRMKIPFEMPGTKKKIEIPVALALLYRKIWNGLEGNGKDIEDIIDRMDGKVAQEILGEGFANQFVTIFRNAKSQEEEKPATTKTSTELPTR